MLTITLLHMTLLTAILNSCTIVIPVHTLEIVYLLSCLTKSAESGGIFFFFISPDFQACLHMLDHGIVCDMVDI